MTVADEVDAPPAARTVAERAGGGGRRRWRSRWAPPSRSGRSPSAPRRSATTASSPTWPPAGGSSPATASRVTTSTRSPPGARPWVVQSWLASTIYGWIDRAFGGQGLRVLTGVLAAVVAAMTWRLTRPAKSLIGRIVIAAFVVGPGRDVLVAAAAHVRPGAAHGRSAGRRGRPAAVAADPRVLAVGEHPRLVPARARGHRRSVAGPPGRQAGGDHRVAGAAVRRRGHARRGDQPARAHAAVLPGAAARAAWTCCATSSSGSPRTSPTRWARVFLVQVALAIVLLVRKPSYRAAIPLVLFTARGAAGAAQRARGVDRARARHGPGLPGHRLDQGRGAHARVSRSCSSRWCSSACSWRRPRWPNRPGPSRRSRWRRWRGSRSTTCTGPTCPWPAPTRPATTSSCSTGPRPTSFLDDRVDMYPPERGQRLPHPRARRARRGNTRSTSGACSSCCGPARWRSPASWPSRATGAPSTPTRTGWSPAAAARPSAAPSSAPLLASPVVVSNLRFWCGSVTP